jgi:Protein of unknown function (DUF3768)
VTRAIAAALEPAVQSEILDRVRSFYTFIPGNDPHGEHDFGASSVPVAGEIFWKIDYYDSEVMAEGSEDPADRGRSLPCSHRHACTRILASG